MITYKFGQYQETCDGRKFNVLFSKKCDSDAQAELNARNFSNNNHLNGIIIRRGDVEWFVQ